MVNFQVASKRSSSCQANPSLLSVGKCYKRSEQSYRVLDLPCKDFALCVDGPPRLDETCFPEGEMLADLGSLKEEKTHSKDLIGSFLPNVPIPVPGRNCHRQFKSLILDLKYLCQNMEHRTAALLSHTDLTTMADLTESLDAMRVGRRQSI